MTLYAIYDPKPGKADLPTAVPEQFSWFAALLTPVYLVRHGLWLVLIAWVIKVVALVLVAPYIGGDAAWLLYGLVALWFGLAAPGLRRFGLLGRGWSYRGARVAPSNNMAVLEAIR